MAAEQAHFIRTVYLSGATGPVAVGNVLVSNGTKYVVATSANRTSYGRSACIALTAGDDDDTAVHAQFTGYVPASVTGLTAGTATWVIVSATGTLERDDTPDSGEDVVGKCNARGDLFLAPGVWDSTNVSPGGGAASEGAATAVNVSDGSGGWNEATNVKAGAGYIAIGANPAEGGAVRLSSNDFVTSEGDGAEYELIGLVNDVDGDRIEIGNDAGIPVRISAGAADDVHLVGQAILLEANAWVLGDDVDVDPSLSTGTGAPADAKPDGSLYLRKDGTASTGLYTRQDGAWEAVGGGPTWFNVKDFGALGDAVFSVGPGSALSSGTDDSAAFAAAIAAATAAGGGTVYVPQGNYRLSTDMTPVSLQVFFRTISFIGDGTNSIIILDAPTNAISIDATNGSVAFENLHFVGNGGDCGSTPIQVGNASQCIFRKCLFSFCDPGGPTLIYCVGNVQNAFEDSRFHGCGGSSATSGVVYANLCGSFVMRRCLFEDGSVTGHAGPWVRIGDPNGYVPLSMYAQGLIAFDDVCLDETHSAGDGAIQIEPLTAGQRWQNVEINNVRINQALAAPDVATGMRIVRTNRLVIKNSLCLYPGANVTYSSYGLTLVDAGNVTIDDYELSIIPDSSTRKISIDALTKSVEFIGCENEDGDLLYEIVFATTPIPCFHVSNGIRSRWLIASDTVEAQRLVTWTSARRVALAPTTGGITTLAGVALDDASADDLVRVVQVCGQLVMVECDADVGVGQSLSSSDLVAGNVRAASPGDGMAGIAAEDVGETTADQVLMYLNIGGAAPAFISGYGFDPATLALSGWWHASYAGSPWAAVASAGASGTNGSLTEATNPPATGAAVNGLTPADFDGTNDILANANDTISTFVTSNAGSFAVLFWADAAPADSGAGAPYTDSVLMASTTGAGSDLGLLFNTSGFGLGFMDGTWKRAITACSTGAWHLGQARWDLTNLEVRVDGGSWVQTAASGGGITAVAGAKLRLGTVYNAAQFFNGKILEFMSATTKLTDQNFDDIKDYVNTKYGLAL